MSRRLVALLVAGLVVQAAGPARAAGTTWGDWHWARAGGPATLTIVASVTPTWSAPLADAAARWSISPDLDETVVLGESDEPSRASCALLAGVIHVCDDDLGPTGWLGLTDIAVDASGHITAARVRLNDYYVGRRTKGVALRHTVCHELGHAVGLGHQFGRSCMNPYDGLGKQAWEWPAASDYAVLLTLYAHADPLT